MMRSFVSSMHHHEKHLAIGKLVLCEHHDPPNEIPVMIR